MKTLGKWMAAAALSCSMMITSPLAAQQGSKRAMVSLYHAPPGHQEALIRYLADQDRVAAAAGVAPTQVYVHAGGGDSWDFMVIHPITTDAQDAAMDVAAKKMGVVYGPRAGLEFRKHIQSHTDTFVKGPMTAAQYLESIAQK